MPRELVTVAPRTPGFREYAEPPLGDTQIRIRTEFAAPKHGTEMVSYRAGRTDRRYDADWGCFMPVPPSPDAERDLSPGFPGQYGYRCRDGGRRGRDRVPRG